MAGAVAAADNERLMAEAAQAPAQAQAGAHQGTEWEAKFDEMGTHRDLHKRLLTAYEDTVWVRTQRAEKAAGTMSEERRRRLEALQFWKWETEFDVFVADLTQHHVKHGCMPEKGAGADWLANKQNRYSRSMSEANKKMIAARGGPVAAAIMGGAGPGPGQAIRGIHVDSWTIG